MQNLGFLIFVVLCAAISLSFTGARLLADRRARQSFNAGDYSIIAAQIFYLGAFVGNVIVIVELDQHSHPPDYIPKTFFIGIFSYFSCIWCVKLTINFLYLRLSRDSPVYRPTLGVLIIVCVSGVTVLLGQLFACWPISQRFTPLAIGDQSCAATNYAIFWTTYALNMSTDIMLFAIPFFILKSLTNKYLKLALSVVFTLAAVVMISTSVGAALITIARASNTLNIMVLGTIDCTLAIVISALPALSSPLTRYWQRKDGSKGRLNSYQETPDPSMGTVLGVSNITTCTKSLSMEGTRDVQKRESVPGQITCVCVTSHDVCSLNPPCVKGV